MSKFVVVPEAPKPLRAGEYVIERPNFVEEIRENMSKAPRGNKTATGFLRSIAGAIGDKYDKELTAWTVKTHNYEGRHYANEYELSAIVCEMLRASYPSIFKKYVDFKIRNRPMNVKVIYYVGDWTETTPFFDNGIDSIALKDIEAELGAKAKKPLTKNVEDADQKSASV
jgi:hypothetical protein